MIRLCHRNSILKLSKSFCKINEVFECKVQSVMHILGYTAQTVYILICVTLCVKESFFLSTLANP